MELVKVDQKEPKNNKEIALRDFVRFARKATQGIGASTEAEARDLLKKLMKFGHITPEQEEKLLSTLLGRMKQGREQFEKKIGESLQLATKKLIDISTKELSRIEKQISEIEKRMEKTSKVKK